MTGDFEKRFRRAEARDLRFNATDAEVRLWRRLRRFPVAGTHFRRQVSIGPYVADFACMAARLIIEVDGSQHGDEENLKRDERRTRWFESNGYRVIRFWNNDISRNIDGVLEAIYAALYGSLDAEAAPLKHQRRRHPRRHPTPALRADPLLAGEGEASGESLPASRPRGRGSDAP